MTSVNRPRFLGPPGKFGAVAVVLCGILLATVSGCHNRRIQQEETEPKIAWPPPPAQPRIEYLTAFRDPRDLGIRKNWFVRFVSYLGRGRRATGMVRPHGIAVAADGSIAVADPDARSVHLFDKTRSRYRRLLEADGKPLGSPVGVAIDGEGRIYVADSARGAVFRFTSKGKWLDTLGGNGELQRPTGLALDRHRDLLWVVDTLAHRVAGFDLQGSPVLSFGRRGTGDGEFNYPVAVAVGPQGRLYVTDAMNFRVQIFDATGNFIGAFGKPGNGPGDFDKAKGVAVDASGHVYVVEALHDVIHVFDPDGRLLTVIGGTGAGPGQFWLPTGIHIDSRGRILIADSANHRIQILQYLGGREGGDRG